MGGSPKRRLGSPGRFALTLAAILVVAAAAAHSVHTVHGIATAPAEYRAQYVPDDAFYYLVLARNFASQGIWSFDSGVSRTSGFHPLHAYALVGIYELMRPSPERFVELAVLLSFLAAMPAWVLGALFAFRSRQAAPFLLFLLFVMSRNVSLNLVSAVEWSWVVTLAALYVLVFSLSRRLHAGRAFLLLLGLGFLGSLARTDFGLLPAALAAAMLVRERALPGGERLKASLAGVAGSSAGVLAVLVHNLLATGQALQSSARMKGLWLEVDGMSASPFVRELRTLFGDSSGLTSVLCVVLALLALFLGIQRFLRGSRDIRDARPDTVWLGSVFTIAGYGVFYALNPAALQHWYTACLVVPVFLAICLPVAHSRRLHPVATAISLVLVVLVGLQLPRAARFLKTPEWPHGAAMYRAGQYLCEARLEGRVGSWNAGIIGYYDGGHVINLDGLVNNGIYAYARRNALPSYIDSLSIRYIVDFENMFSSQRRRLRGGYDSPAFLSRLKPLARFDDRDEGWKRLTLFEVSPVANELR